MADFLLSICIPTYNRCDILNDALNSIVSDPFFTNKVEVVISDNCSTDNTKKIIEGYASKYSNIKYFSNKINISAEENFIKVLDMAHGEYIKLSNDSIIFKPGSLKFMIEAIEKNIATRESIFFYHDLSRDGEQDECLGLNDFIKTASFWSTWISNFGAWREQYNKIENKNIAQYKKLLQVDWSLKIVNSSSKTIIYFKNLYVDASLASKGGYNIFQVFIVNYLSLYDEYIKSGKITKNTFRKEKVRLFKGFIYKWLHNCFIRTIDDELKFKFDTKGAFKILFKYYWYLPHLYITLIVIFLKNIIRFIVPRKMFKYIKGVI